MRGSKLYLNLKQWQSTTTSIWRLKKSAKIEMKELMKGQLRNLHLRKLSPIERFKMAFVKVIEFIGFFLPDCSKNDVSMLLAWHVHSLISASNQKSTCHNLLTWNPKGFNENCACCTEEGILFTAVSRTTATCSKVSDTLKAQCWCRQHLL